MAEETNKDNDKKSTKATAETSKKEEVDVSTIGVSSTSFKRIQGYIKNAVDGLEESYHKDKKIVTEKQFKKNAQRIVEQVQNKYDDAWKRNEQQTKEMNAFVEEIINQAAAKYKEDLVDIKANTVKKTESSVVKSDGSYDYDPEIINDGETNAYSVMPIKKSTIQTMADGSKKEIISEEKRNQLSIYHATNASYSGADMVCTIKFDTYSGYNICTTLGTLQTISYSIYQNKTPVRVLGNMNAKDWVFGPRTIAGSLVFAVFNKHWLIDLYEELYKNADMKGWHFIADEIPPFDITITFANEYGFDSKMVIYGVRLMNEGQTMSTNDIYIENTYQFVANDINLMDTLTAYQKNSSIHAAVGTVKVQTAKLKNREIYSPKKEETDSKENKDQKRTIEDAIKELNVTRERWNKECIDTGLDYDKAKSNLKKEIKEKYKALKKEFSSKEDKKKLEEAYDKAIKTINEYYNLSKKGKLEIEVDYNNAPHAEQIRLMLQYDDLKMKQYIKDEGGVSEAIVKYSNYIDQCLNKVQERLDIGLYNELDLNFAKKLARETKATIMSKNTSEDIPTNSNPDTGEAVVNPGNASNSKKKSEIDKLFVNFSTKWEELQRKNISASATLTSYMSFIQGILKDIKANNKYNDDDKAYAQKTFDELKTKADKEYEKMFKAEQEMTGGR